MVVVPNASARINELESEAVCGASNAIVAFRAYVGFNVRSCVGMYFHLSSMTWLIAMDQSLIQSAML